MNKLIVIFSVTLAFLSSCKKDVVNPPYVGTWVENEIVNFGGSQVQYKDMIILTKDGFTNIGQLYDSASNKFIDYSKMIGTLVVTESSMTTTVTEIGYSTVDMITGKPSGIITTYKAGTAEFSAIIMQSGVIVTSTSTYVITGNTMTFKTDVNSDGDYLDPGEVVVYTKQ